MVSIAVFLLEIDVLRYLGRLMELHNIHLRRAYWAVFSPPLLLLPQTVNYIQDEAHKSSLLHLFLELDKNQDAVNAHFNALGNMPMGKYFEQLLFFILKHDDRYDIVLQNHQILNGKTTVGELDVVLKNMSTGQIEHWEIALKYYLQTHPSESYSCMVGPNAKDNLERKMNKLITHQLPLQTDLTKSGITDTSTVSNRLCLKGQFFYHLNMRKIEPMHASADHEKGWWCFSSEIERILTDQFRYSVIQKPDWIGTMLLPNNARLQRPSELRTWLKEHFNQESQHICIIGLVKQGTHWIEATRGFVVRNNWPA